MKLFKHSISIIAIILLVSCEQKETKSITFQPDVTLGKDTAISESNKTANFSTLDRIHALSLSTNDSVKNDVRALIRFGFATLQEGVTIDSAFVHFQAIDSGHFGKNNSFMLIPIKNVWINDEVNWENQPNVDKDKAIFADSPSDPNQNYKINVTEYVTAVFKNNQPNYGFMIQLQDEKKAYKGISFHSSNSKETSKHPKLEIFYHE